jgi:hypothetical protein
MKFGKIFLVMLVALALTTIGVVAAEQSSVSGHSFKIPDGYQIEKKDTDKIFLSKDNDHVIVLTIKDQLKSPSDLRDQYEKMGYKCIGEYKYNADGKQVIQQNYETLGVQFMAYMFDAGNDECLVSYIMPENETPSSGAANPVSTILGTIK